MKKILMLFFLALSLNGFSQDTSKVEQYCLAVATGKIFSTKVSLTLDFGEDRNYWKDQRLKDEEGKAKNFNSSVDGLNYLGKMGWKIVNAFSVSLSNGGSLFYYIFKKEFTKKETE